LDWLDAPRTDTGVRFAPDNPADDWSFVPYSELAECVLRMVGLLEGHGVRRDDVVSIVVPEPHDFLLAFYGALAAGATASPLAPPLTFRSIEVYIQHLADVMVTASPGVILVAPQLVDPVVAALERIGSATTIVPFTADGLASQNVGSRQASAAHVLLQYTSGSSGTPKGVQVSAENLDINTHAMRTLLDLHADDVVVSWLPHYHDMGLIGSLLTTIRIGADIRLLKPAQFVRSPRRWLECLGRDGGTHTLSPSFGYSYAARRVNPADLDGLDFSNWRVGLVAAERTDVVGVGDFVSFAQPHGFSPNTVMVGYGLAEATLCVSATPPRAPVPVVRLAQTALHDNEAVQIAERAFLGDSDLREGNWVTACGVPVERTEIRIVDENGLALPDGHHGQIQIRSDSVAQGYRGAPHTNTSTSFEGDTLNTGDTGFLLDGQVYVVGRTGDSIKVRGVKLFAEDLDIKIGEVSGLNAGRYVALLGTAGGADVVAAILETDDIACLDPVRSALSAMVSEDIAVALFRGDEGCIERTSSGKPRRRVLWRRLLDGDLPVELIYTSAKRLPWREPLTSPSTI
jgi:acyl-CoA synthetase (AMP-forming)/AMP-acid ligase II